MSSGASVIPPTTTSASGFCTWLPIPVDSAAGNKPIAATRQVITTGLVNMRRFEQRSNETLVLAELLDRPVSVTTPEDRYDATVEDIAIEQERNRDWVIVKVFVRKGLTQTGSRGISRLGRRRGAQGVQAGLRRRGRLLQHGIDAAHV